MDDAASALPAASRPLRVSKEALSRVLACERHHVATAGQAAGRRLSEPIARGIVLDRLLHHRVHGEPCATAPWEVVDDALLAERDDELLAWLDEDPERRARLAEDAVAFASELDSWPAVDDAWWPRCEERLRVTFGGGAVTCPARVDVVLGGPGTGRPIVLLEAKSGPFRREHLDGLLWYALLAALRHGTPPAGVIGWSAFDGRTWVQPVTAPLLAAAADRACAAILALAGLAGGREPTATPGAACTWCPVRSSCDVAPSGDDLDGP